MIFGNAAAQRNDLAHRATGGRFYGTEFEGFDVDAAPHGLRLKDIHDVAHLELVIRDQRDLLAVGLDAGLAVLEIEAIFDFLTRLIERVLEFLPIDARHDVERRFARQDLPYSSQSVNACSTTAPGPPNLPSSLPST